MLLIKCDKCGKETKECSQIKFVSRREKIREDGSLVYTNEVTTNTRELCPSCVNKLLKEWMEI